MEEGAKRPRRSRRKANPNENEVKECYCRICMGTKPVKFFHETTDPFIDRNGYFSICKECVNELYSKFLLSEGSIERAVLRLCRIMNVAYNETAIQAAIIHSEKRENSSESIFGLYKSKLVSLQKINRDLPLTFSEPTAIPMFTDDMDVDESNHDIRIFWGEGLTTSDYRFLETELADWQKTHKSDTKAEITLLKEICFKQLEIRKARLEGKSVDSSLKSLQELMRTASVDPAKANVASGGKSVETFGQFIRIIEEKEPAEVFSDKRLFADFDGIESYLKRYIYRPIKNFIIGSKDFNINDEEDLPEDDDLIDYTEDNSGEEE